jgi:quercetin dioxygenase-like cupin family protein
MKKIRSSPRTMGRKLLGVTPFSALLFFAVVAGSAQSPEHGIVRPLSNVKFAPDDDVKCLADVLEKGDPAAGASTFLLKAAPNCVVPAHYHTAQEQLIVVRGDVLTGMKDMAPLILGPGGFAMMPSKQVHWFTCTSKDGCLMFVTFDRTYDIVWAKQNK